MSLTLTGFDNKVAIVTGAGRMRSIGRPIALTLAKAGCDVVLTGTGKSPERYPDDEKAAGWRDIESVADEIRAQGRRALPLVSDVSSPEAVEALADRILAEFGRVDFVINNAGSTKGQDRQPVVTLPVNEWQRVIDTNLNGSFYMCQTFARRMIDLDQGGAIINISTLGTRLLAAGTAAYASSKVAINGLTTILSGELGRYGIRVNGVCPGLIDTSRLDDMGRGDIWEQLVKSFIPLGRAGTGEDIANMVAFLCSEQGAWINGQNIYVDGGYTNVPLMGN
ncbi:SDR family NAD(P)-dependent oxidoreductase [Denitratisoma oestradiolicum]|uniref:Short-chain dehydrogenase n=1 Tax=Denitratisoma oestradiolicum TaxID=311182 RepID=A0A6S6Y0C0_9PROT|nr:SDR family NAD(P)-dependent oxidoreductase [Denitratisoma oestradiolicum]TWO80388.1 short-chain dehydrogenase [Denitratisoma oestradiolicum]CAB1370191.1 Short-chain dehydrogenase [Denitratisoma oestradiolicum]